MAEEEEPEAMRVEEEEEEEEDDDEVGEWKRKLKSLKSESVRSVPRGRI